ncbi:hypothetical protein JR065_06865 [Xanthomonas sp. AmX2]|nr:hypothetical protein [Xanthomonas sp.]
MGVGLAALLAAAPCFAGAWVQDDGATLAILKASHADDGSVYTDSGRRTHFPDGGRSRQDQLNLYIEYGLNADLTAIGNFYVTEAAYRSDTFRGRTRGPADQEMGLRYRLDPDGGDGPWQGAVQALLSVPAYDRDDQPALGLGDYGLELRYSVGRGYTLGGLDAYVDAGAAVRLRGGSAADEARLDVSSGVALAPRWMLIGEANAIQGLGNGSGRNPTNFIDTTDYDLTKLQLSLLHTLPGGTQLQLGYQQPVAGRNTGGAGGPFAAAWWRF